MFTFLFFLLYTVDFGSPRVRLSTRKHFSVLSFRLLFTTIRLLTMPSPGHRSKVHVLFDPSSGLALHFVRGARSLLAIPESFRSSHVIYYLALYFVSYGSLH